MNIDLATLLLGGASGKPRTAGLLADEGFSLALDDKLSALAQLFPDIEPQALAAALPVELLPHEITDPPVIDGELIADNARLAEALTGITLDESEGGESPQWQLQQLVVRSMTGAEPVVQAAVGKPSEGAPGEKPGEPRGKLAAPLTAADKSPSSNALSPVSASASASASVSVSSTQASMTATSSEAVATTTAEMVSAPAVNAVAVPAAVRTSVIHAPQQVVTVNHPPETPEWKQSVSQHIALFSRNGLHSAEIRLNPEELGSLHISLRMQQDQAQIHIVSEHGHIRQMMEQAMPQLRAAMAESGIQLGQANVSAEGQQAASGEQGGDAQAEHPVESEGEEGLVESEIVPTLLTTTPGNIYGINTFV